MMMVRTTATWSFYTVLSGETEKDVLMQESGKCAMNYRK